MTSSGQQAGGIVGFLKAVQRLVEMTSPSDIYVIWESGGNTRRRALLSTYKQNRRPPKLNRFYEDIPDSMENRLSQIKSLTKIMQNLPICQIYVEDLEADDIIGFLCCNKFKNQKIIIGSSDRDFYQLLNENVIQYNWKKFIGSADVLKELHVSHLNVAVTKSLVGDSSDNIPGIKGIGFKTAAKLFPQLATENEVTINDIINEAKSQVSNRKKIFQQICENTDVIKRNWRLMYLDMAAIGYKQARHIEAIVNSFEKKKNKMQLMRDLIEEGLETFDAHDLFSAFIPV